MPDPPLVGRKQDLETLTRHVVLAGSAGLQVALISGAAGLGKTRLATELLAAHAGTWWCLTARSYRWGAAESFGLWAEALDRELRMRDRDEVIELLEPWLPELASLLTVAAEVAGTRPERSGRTHVLEGLVGVFDRLSRERPVLLHLDDVHLADSSSWDVLRYLSRRLVDAPIAVVMTARQAALEERPIATEVLLGLTEDRRLLRLPLRPLSRAELTRLAHDVIRGEAGDRPALVTEPLVRWLMARSLGHPLFAIDLLRALLEDDADLVTPRLSRLPAGLRDRVALEVAALDRDARRLLDLLAVADHRLELPHLVRLAGGQLAEVDEVLDRLARTRLVAERPNGPRVSFEVAHPIVQEAIYQTIGGAHRRALHRRIAETLLDVDAFGAAAGHLACGAEPGDTAAVEALCRAMADAESRGLHREALAILGALLDLLPDGDPQWTEVLAAMGWQPEWVLSHLAETDAPIAISAMRRIAAQVAGDDPAAEATVRFHLASFLSFGAGQLDEAEAAARRAVELFEAAGQPERALLGRNELAWLRSQRASILGLVGRLAEATRCANEALEDRVNAPDVLAFENRAQLHWLAGEFGAALGDLEAAAIHRSVRGSPRRAWAAALGARIHAERGDLARAESMVRVAADTYRGEPFLVWGWWQGWSEAFLAWCDTDHSQALACFDAVTEQLRDLGAAPYEALVLVDLSVCALDHGDGQRCQQAAQWLSVLAAGLGGDLHRSLAALGRALACLSVGDEPAASREAAVAEQGLAPSGYALYHALALALRGRSLAHTDRRGARASVTDRP